MRCPHRLAGPILLALAVTACGGGSSGEAGRPAQQIVRDALAAAQRAESVHVVGTVDDNGAEIGLDLRLVNGKGGVGTVSYKGDRADLVRVDGTVYFKAPGEFYVYQGAPAAAGRLLDGRWIAAPVADPDFADFASLTDMRQLFTKGLKPEGTPTKAGTATVHGVAAVRLVDSKGGRDAGTLYVAATGRPLPLEVDSGPASGGAGHVRFTEWDAPVHLVAPKDALDLSRLERGGTG